jgi:hypothetical protein
MDDVLTLPDAPEDETNGLDLEPTYEPVMQCEGRYEVDPIPGGKRFQGSWLVLDDGTRYVLSYRPNPDYFLFVDKRVRVTGRPYTPGRDTQHMLAAHFQIISIELAPGEIQYADPPSQLPAPPILRTLDEIRMRVGRWGQVVGHLIALQDEEDTHFKIAHLELEDGIRIIARNAAERQWKPYLGSIITIVSRIEMSSSGGASTDDENAVILTGWYAICPGETNYCGK